MSDAVNEVLNKSLQFAYQKNDGYTCPICMDTITIGTNVCCLPCSHVFCPNCIRQALETNISCPICRISPLEKFKEIEEYRNRNNRPNQNSNNNGNHPPPRPPPPVINNNRRGRNVRDRNGRGRNGRDRNRTHSRTNVPQKPRNYRNIDRNRTHSRPNVPQRPRNNRKNIIQ